MYFLPQKLFLFYLFTKQKYCLFKYISGLYCFIFYCSYKYILIYFLSVINYRDTPTSAGPNSFGKTRQGFCDSKKVFERQLKEKMEEVGEKWLVILFISCVHSPYYFREREKKEILYIAKLGFFA